MILDASAAAMFLLPDELEPLPAVERRLAEGPLLVPQHWAVEVASMLLNAERRLRISRSTRDRAVAQLLAWSVRVDPGTSEMVWETTFNLATAHRLTIYDAAYLELAIRSRHLLASNDRALVAAARAKGADVLTSLA